MLIKQTEIIQANQEKAYFLVKNELENIVNYFPSVDRIKQVEKDTSSSDFDLIVNHWYAKVNIPFFLRSFLSKDLFSWKDKAHWVDEKYKVTYDLESFYGNDLFEAKGQNQFTDLGSSKTKLDLMCDIKINAQKIPGIPSSIAKKVVPTIEKIIKKMLQPNLAGLGQALNSYLSHENLK